MTSASGRAGATNTTVLAKADLSRTAALAKADLSRTAFVKLDTDKLFWLFVVISVGGLVGETLVSYPIDGIIKNRAGLIWGPFSPLYGLAGVILTLALNKHWRDSLLKQFLIGALAGGLTEGIGGFLLKNIFGIVAWSYLSHPLNFWGFTSVPMMCVWGCVGLLWFRFLLPVVYRAIGCIETAIGPRAYLWITAACMAFMAADIAMTLVGFFCWFDRLAGHTPDNAIAAYFAQHYDNAYMSGQFGALSMFTEIASR